VIRFIQFGKFKTLKANVSVKEMEEENEKLKLKNSK
tara:strand:+ start:269 stop:376 length:108 start_codon:yes stop_codon:yes gene_type:complete